MSSGQLKFRIFIGILCVVTVLGTGGFMLIEHMSLPDAFYLTMVTISTVGYGDVHPVTNAGKMFAVLVIAMGAGAFVGAIANAIENMLTKRDVHARMDKLNMVIGAFLSEVGTYLLTSFAAADPDLDTVRSQFLVRPSWTKKDFQRAHQCAQGHDFGLELSKLPVEELSAFLQDKRDFLLRLLENPTLLEHESFTNLLWAVFHLTEELTCRKDTRNLPGTDRAHLAGDATRVYKRLVIQWIAHMRHLKAAYPYLFSLSVRMNPFDRDASPIVQ